MGECLTNTIRKIGLQDEVRNYRQLLHVRGYVLLGMKDAKHYGRLYRYRTQRFFLSLRDGNVIRATVRSQPLDDTENLPIFEIPQSNLEATVALLRKSLQSKKA